MICSRPDGLMFPLGGTTNDAWQKFGLHVTRERFYTSVTTSQTLHCYSSFMQSEKIYLANGLLKFKRRLVRFILMHRRTQWTCGPHK
jgi:hypothetical protein